MANVRQIRKHLKAVQNIRTITKTLETVSVSRFQRAQGRFRRAQAGASAVEEILRSLPAFAKGATHPLLASPPEGVRKLVVLASDRGMCGGYNRRVVESALEEARRLAQGPFRVRFHVIGRRGIAKVQGRLAADAAGLAPQRLAPPHAFAPGPPEAELPRRAEALAAEICSEMLAGKLASVHVAWMRQTPGGSLAPAIEPVLPLQPRGESAGEAEYDLYPDLARVLAVLLPLAVRVRLTECFLEAVATEHLARLAAMRSATENADEIIQNLTRSMNRARQGRITAELAEIVGTTDAVKGTR